MLRSTLVLFIAIVLCPLAYCVQPQNTGTFCQDCRSTVSYLSKFNSTKQRDAYKEVFTNFCQIYYPNSTDYQRGPCGIIVGTMFYLLENTDAINHCDQIGACTTKPGALQLKPASKPIKNVVCDVCVSSVESVKRQLSDPANIEYLKSQLDALCEYLKVIDESRECKEQIVKLIDYLRNFAAQIDPESYCESVQLCSSAPARVAVKKINVQVFQNQIPSLIELGGFGIQLDSKIGLAAAESEPEPINPKHHSKGPACTLCRFVFAELTHILHANTTKENIEHNLDKICDLVYKHQDPHQQQCVELISKYSDEIINILSEELDPEMICVLLEECVYQPSANQISTNQVVTSEPSRKVETVGDLFLLLDSSLVEGSMEVCVECKLLIRYLQTKMKDPSSEAELAATIKKDLCDKLPTESRNSCYSVIDKYAVDFFKAVAENLDPSQTCVNVGACKPRPKQDLFDLVNSMLESVLKPMIKPDIKINAPVCDECVEVIEKIDEYISKNDINNDVNKIIDNVCETLKPSLVNKCTYIVEVLGNELIRAITNMDSPKSLCTKIHLC